MYLEVTVVLLWDLSFLEGDRRYPRTEPACKLLIFCMRCIRIIQRIRYYIFS